MGIISLTNQLYFSSKLRLLTDLYLGDIVQTFYNLRGALETTLNLIVLCSTQIAILYLTVLQ